MGNAEPLVALAEIEAEAHWTVRADVDGAVQSDWAGRPAVPVSVAAELFERAVDERNRLFLERQERLAAKAAERSTPIPVADARLQALADNGFRGVK